MASLLYAGDYDEHIPRVNNHGDCNYEPVACQYPLLNHLIVPAGETVQAAEVFYMNVIQPYMKSYSIIYCPEIGRTDWRSVVSSVSMLEGYPVEWGGSYDPQKEALYAAGFPQMAVNMFDTDVFGGWTSLIGVPSAAQNLAAIARTSENVLLVSDTVYEFRPDTVTAWQLKFGFPFTWTEAPGSNCVDMGDPGNWYVHNAPGSPVLLQPGAETMDPTLPQYRGLTSVAFADGHAKSFHYAALSTCEYNEAHNYWQFKYWDPTY